MSRNYFFVVNAVLIMLCAVVSSPVFAAAKTTPSVAPTASIVIPNDYAPTKGIAVIISPPFITLTTDPGKEVSSQLRITNDNNFDEYLKIRVEKFTSGPNGSTPVVKEMQPGDTYANWVNFSEQNFKLEANQTKTIKFTINPPQEASLGYYYAFVIERMKNENGNATAVVSGAAAVPVLLDVRSPNAKRELQVQSITTDNLFYETLPAQFNVTVKNTGNVYLAPFGDIFIDSMLHNNVDVLSFNKGRGNILPDGSRVYTVTWSDGFPVRQPKMENGIPVKDSKGHIVYETKYDFSQANKFRIGKYTAHLLMAYDNGERDVPVEATISFWVIPWKILGVVGVVVLLALIGLVSNMRRVWKMFHHG